MVSPWRVGVEGVSSLHLVLDHIWQVQGGSARERLFSENPCADAKLTCYAFGKSQVYNSTH